MRSGIILRMVTELDLWRLAAGLGLFLFGMSQLEQSLQLLAGRPFKKFLRDHTSRPLQGVLVGAASTAALQSSSVVSLIVLAFVGTGIVSLESAISIVFGSNLGTTATGWIVATLGFKLDIEMLALPLVAVGGLAVAWSRPGSRPAGAGHLVAGFGLMLMGLAFMKSGASQASALFDPAALSAYPPVVFLLIGLLVAAVIQSSSATIMITLSALYAGAIPLPSAAAVVIGADLGTTVTAILGALAGSLDKRRVAIALIVFNAVTDGIAFAALYPLLGFITHVLMISDPLFALVGFHSLFNLIGIVLFLPATPALSRWLAGRLRRTDVRLLHHIKDADLAVPEAAIENVGRETLRLIDQAVALNCVALRLPVRQPFYEAGDDRAGVQLFGHRPVYEASYDSIKRLEGEMLAFLVKLQTQRLDPQESARVGQVLVAIRDAVHSAKYVKDTRHDLESFRNNVDDGLNAWFGRYRDAVAAFYEKLPALQAATSVQNRFEILVALKASNEDIHKNLHSEIHREIMSGSLSDVRISTLLNVNRELYLANQSLLNSLADMLLDAGSAADLDAIPARK